LSPWTTLNTPSGSPASFRSSARISEAEGSRSEGFKMKQLPQASATGNIHIGTIAGKLNGVIPATTPSGCRSAWLSTRVPTFSVISPFKRCGAPVANSTTSMPRWMSPLASGSVLPCSEERASASLSMSRLRSWTNFISTRARRCGLVAAQAGWAALAFSTAARTSPALASGHFACTSPVAGL
jgi:hypothetical protein